MSPRILVVGSGPSSMGAVWGLLKRAIHPEIWDVGESLPPENEILKEGIKNGSVRRNKKLVQN